MSQGRGIARFGAFSGVVALSTMLGCAGTPVARFDTPRPRILQAVARQDISHGTPFSSPDFGFELDKPAGNDWAVATNVVSPEGRPIPVVVAHPESGAQIVIQVSDPVDTPKTLAYMLRQKLQAEQHLDLGTPAKVTMDSGADAYGFDFAVKGEAKGRVAVIACGDQIILVVASWPVNANGQIVRDIDGVVRSVRTVSGTIRTSVRPDKASLPEGPARERSPVPSSQASSPPGRRTSHSPAAPSDPTRCRATRGS
jgi:hypothetical protein